MKVGAVELILDHSKLDCENCYKLSGVVISMYTYYYVILLSRESLESWPPSND